MNEAMTERWNEAVSPGDLVYHLGDFAMTRSGDVSMYLSRLNGRVVLVRGNHDKRIPQNHPGFEHISNFEEVKIGDYQIFMSHYAHRVWAGHANGVIHLYGHSHANLPGIGRSMDVGVDTNDFRPYSLEEIVARMKKIPTIAGAAA